MNDSEVMTLDKDKLQKILEEKGVSRKELAIASLVSLGSINHWFSGRNPKAVYIAAIARALGVSVSRITKKES